MAHVAGAQDGDLSLGRIERSKTSIAVVLLALAACQVEERVTQPAPPPPPEPVAPAPPTERVDALLDRAEAAFRDERLLHPAADSALTHYLAVLELVTDQPDALEGIERIVESFLQRAQDAIRQQRWAAARSMLDRARLVDGDHPSLPSLYTQLQRLRDAERIHLDLSSAAVRDRTADAADALARLGVRARQDNARVLIRAGSDVQGRWIYAQLNRAPGNRRIRAEMEVGWPPRVVVVLFAHPDPSGEGG